MHKLDCGIYSNLLSLCNLDDSCFDCDSFNLSIKDKYKRYRCRCAPNCLPATIHPHLLSYFNWKIGLIDGREHMKNIEVKK